MGVFTTVFVFGLFCQAGGVLISYYVYWVIGTFCSRVLNESYLITLEIWEWNPAFWQYPAVFLLVCSAMFLIPAWRVYRVSPMDVLSEGFDA